MTKLRGLAWDHRRCWGPLQASIAPFCSSHPELEITWDRRSLYEFGEGAMDAALAAYDLVIIDHPFVGEISRDQLAVPFDPYLKVADRAAFERNSVGQSWNSYAIDGRQWALPIDAACHVASCRPDLIEPYGDLPSNHDQVAELGRLLRRDGKWLGLPLMPTDAMCQLLTLANPAASSDEFIGRETMERVIDELRELVSLAHPKSVEWNPIRCYDYMIAHDDVVYVPFAFGYVNYASRTEGTYLKFADAPLPGSAGAILGGAGICVSSRSREQKTAIDYALFLCSAEYQGGPYVREGGQPASLMAWRDDDVNAASRGFFRSTLRTIQTSYLRPRHPGFVAFFREAAPRVAAAIRGEVTTADLSVWINDRYREGLPAGRNRRSFA
jgi:multiple sugar transport system substrate-binding protein